MKIRDYFSNNFETGENHYLENLKTRYYRARNEEVKKVIDELIIAEKGVLKAKNDNFCEIFYECPEYSCTVVVISPRPTETAVDLNVTTYKILPFEKPTKIIDRIYKYLDSKLPFKGVSLYK
jgi:hypothetical protein